MCWLGEIQKKKDKFLALLTGYEKHPRGTPGVTGCEQNSDYNFLQAYCNNLQAPPSSHQFTIYEPTTKAAVGRHDSHRPVASSHRSIQL